MSSWLSSHHLGCGAWQNPRPHQRGGMVQPGETGWKELLLSLVVVACWCQGVGEGVLCPRRGVILPPAPLLCLPSAVPDSVPTRARTARQCLLIRVPVCPHSSFGHLAWQIGAHGKMGKETLRPGWVWFSPFFVFGLFFFL